MKRPFVDITIGGSPSGLFLGQGLKSFTYHDAHHGEVDDLSFVVADDKGLWRSGWGVDEGTVVSALMGYENGALTPCGSFAIDETSASGDASGDVAEFKGLAAFTSKDLRTDRSEAYDQMTLKAIVSKVAGRHSLKVMGMIPDLKFKRITQNKQSDLAFLTRLADDWGCYFTVRGDQLVFIAREELEKAAPVRVIDLLPGDVMPYNLRKSTKGLYSKATVKYLDPKTKKLTTAEREDKRVKSGDTLKIEERAESPAHAKRLCLARLARANDELGTGDVTVVGDPLLVSGQVIMIGPGLGKYAGRWLITSAEHYFSSGGYTTTINIKAL